MIHFMHERPAVEIKTSYQQAKQLGSTSQDIVPSAHLDKAHWSTVFLDDEITDSLIYRLD